MSAPHIDPESPAFKADMAEVDKIEKAEAAHAVLAASSHVMGSAGLTETRWRSRLPAVW